MYFEAFVANLGPGQYVHPPGTPFEKIHFLGNFQHWPKGNFRPMCLVGANTWARSKIRGMARNTPKKHFEYPASTLAWFLASVRFNKKFEK